MKNLFLLLAAITVGAFLVLMLWERPILVLSVAVCSIALFLYGSLPRYK